MTDEKDARIKELEVENAELRDVLDQFTAAILRRIEETPNDMPLKARGVRSIIEDAVAVFGKWGKS